MDVAGDEVVIAEFHGVAALAAGHAGEAAGVGGDFGQRHEDGNGLQVAGNTGSYRLSDAAGGRSRCREAPTKQLWAIHEADIGDCFETYEAAKVGKDGKLETDADGKMRKERPRFLSDLPRDLRKAIEHVQVDARGNVVPQLYSKLQANAELRKMLNIGRTDDRNDLARLSDAELIGQLSDMAKQLAGNAKQQAQRGIGHLLGEHVRRVRHHDAAPRCGVGIDVVVTDTEKLATSG